MSEALKRQLARYEIKNVEGLDGDKKLGGAGSYGAVYEVMVEGVPRIAKQLHDILITPDVRPDQKQGIQERFYQECKLLSELDHPNIVKFVGVHFGSKRRDFDVSLIMERLDTDLDKYLDPKKRPNVPIYIKLSILLDVSFGLLYLHIRKPSPIVHRDLTTSNILLTSDLRAKLADLGVSKLLNVSPNVAAAQTKCPGTLAYMPPEALREVAVYGRALDIFSFGEVCLCTIHQTFAEVYDATDDPDMVNALKRGEVQILKRKKWFETMPAEHCLRDLTKSCLLDQPDKRPTTQHLTEWMSHLCIQNRKSLTGPAQILNEDAYTSLVATKSSLEIQLLQEKNANDELSKNYEDQLAVARAEMEHFKNVSQRHKQQLERAEQVYQQRQAELEQYAERLKGEAEMSKADLIDKAQLVAVEKLSLEEQLAKVNAEFKLKEKQLETTIADKSRLSDEVLAKTQQVRQYRKQIDSYTRELQNFREQNTKMEEDHLHHQQPRPQATPHVSQHASQYKHPGYNQGVNQYQPIRTVAPSTPIQPLYNMPGQQQRPPTQHNQQVHYGSDPTPSLRPSHRIMTAPQAPMQDFGENDAYMNIPADQIPAQQQNQQPLRHVQEDGSEQFQQRVHVDRFEHQYPQREHRMPGQGARQMMGSSAHGGPSHPPPYNQAPTSSQGRSREREYRGGAAPSEQHRGQGPNYPYNQQYPPPTNQPNEQYPATSQSYQPNQQHPQINEGYQGNQGYAQANGSYPPNQQHPPTGKPYNSPKQGQARDYVSVRIQRGGQDQGYPHNQQQSPPYDLPMQSQAGGDQMRQVLGPGVRSHDPQPRRARVGSQGAQGPSPQGPYGGSIAGVPPKVHKVPGNTHPIPAPRSGRRAVQKQSQPSPPMNQHAYPDQLAQHSQPDQPDQLAQHSQPDQPDQLARPDQPVPRVREDTKVQENILLQGIDDDIHQAAEEVQKEEDENEASLSEVPFDPNLVCPLCMIQFRLGEIQKYRKHVGKCKDQ